LKRILLPAGGAVLATGLLAAGLAGTASATPAPTDEYLAKSAQQVADIIDFWTKSDHAALKSATAYHWDYKEVKKLVTKGGYTADTKPGVVAPIGEEKKTAAKVHNVNVPKTIGKVFFEGRDGKLYWCTGSSIQANYKNLVATAGHCVYDMAGNDEVVSRWVFVPGYYQGKTPWGIYVGKQAFTHYDLSVYEDYDRDYAFVTVYNGIGAKFASGSTKQVSKAEYDAHKGEKSVKVEKITEEQYKAGEAQYGPEGPYAYKTNKGAVVPVGHDYVAKAGETKLLLGKEVTAYDYDKAPKATDKLINGEQCPSWCQIDPADPTKAKGQSGKEIAISEAEYKELVAKKAKGEYLGKVEARGGSWYKTQYWVKQHVKVEADSVEYFKIVGYYIEIPASASLVDLGRLGDNVGGQGFAYNQPTGKYVRTFGYPYAEHPDGSKPYTGVTVKNCYGKTSAKLVGSAAKKIEEHVALKCAMTPGADGGPWLLKYSNAKRLGYVNGVTSTFNDQDSNDRVDYISSPYFDGETNTVYKAAANTASGPMFPFPKP
jgi:hypothetical protein